MPCGCHQRGNEKKKREKSDFVGIIIDETLNCTLDKKNDSRVENNGVVETIFLGNYTIDNGTAEMLVKVLEEWLIAERQVVGLGSDGTSVMTG